MFLGLFMCVLYLTVCIPVHGKCATHYDIFQSRERDQNCFDAVLCDTGLLYNNIKGNEGHLGWVCSIALLSFPRVLSLKVQ